MSMYITMPIIVLESCENVLSPPRLFLIFRDFINFRKYDNLIKIIMFGVISGTRGHPMP